LDGVDEYDITGDILMTIEEALSELTNPKDVRFQRALRICETFFGAPRVRGSHHIFKMPWPGDPRINLQRDGSKVKPYQVRDIVRALERLRLEGGKK
jgi:predicted RNA binding protein YcfA (HicA-like mRNA interferase family)